MGEAWALSPLEGRYASYIRELRPYLSEAAFFLYRLRIETAYLRELVSLSLPPLKELSLSYIEALEQTYESRIEQVWPQLKAIEQITRHDVKAIEYFLREQWSRILPSQWHHALAFIHFGLTSQDINTTAQALMQRDALHTVYLPQLQSLIRKLHALAYEWREQTMLSFTHGQPASPTTLGKELYVFVTRLKVEYEHLCNLPFWTKLGGAVGNLNAHYFAYPAIDWEGFFDRFAQRLGLKRFAPTTQILPYERWAELWDSLRRLQAVLIDLAQDLWLYAHRGYIQVQRTQGQIGSSTMPHKSNPVQFELAEGNLRLSNLL
ncbi:MAG: lyase family protein, partial [Bacteroidia bacterium]|nr:lyase family protein [Bacteroidia bacterium]